MTAITAEGVCSMFANKLMVITSKEDDERMEDGTIGVLKWLIAKTRGDVEVPGYRRFSFLRDAAPKDIPSSLAPGIE